MGSLRLLGDKVMVARWLEAGPRKNGIELNTYYHWVCILFAFCLGKKRAPAARVLFIKNEKAPSHETRGPPSVFAILMAGLEKI